MGFHPFAYVSFVMVALFAYVVIRTKADLPTFIGAINSIGNQPTALIVILVGCTMYLLAKQYGLDNSVPSGIVGAGIGMLTSQAKKATEEATEPKEPQ